jgi:hypothetical protein
MPKKIALVGAALAAVLIAAVALQPAEFAVERSATIEAPPHLVYGFIENLRAWEAWSPFSKMDPQQRNEYLGPPAGVGAITTWTGPEAGRGRATIVAVTPDREVDLRLEFEEPMEATHRAVFRLAPRGDATTVTWRLEGRNAFLGKAVSLVTDMDAMVGGEFEKGLASMKSLAERAAAGRQGS